MLVLLSGCTVADTPSAARPSPPDAPDVTIATNENVRDDPLQQQLLADGSVSHAEMERALLAVVTCIRDRGYDAELAGFRAGGDYEMRFDDPGPPESPPDGVLADCEQRMLSRVQPAYLAEHRPSEREIQQRRAALVACLTRLGHDPNNVRRGVMEGVGPRDYERCENAGS